MERLKKILSLEIGIEIKACLYFSIMSFFYFLYCIIQGSFYASIPIMAEIVLTAYAMNYLQVYLLHNFDEAERFDAKTACLSLFCAALYAVVSYLLKWFDGNRTATLCFFFYMILCYVCVFLIYKIRRDIDTACLNQELEQFKSRKKE
ncbi:MAG: DUF3021 family protein [Blautia sp.]|nr:DUF3021 family protein [Blautia sp.]MCM1200825.1 DUF3021 family protein [Bacteroides fragilis]